MAEAKELVVVAAASAASVASPIKGKPWHQQYVQRLAHLQHCMYLPLIMNAVGTNAPYAPARLQGDASVASAMPCCLSSAIGQDGAIAKGSCRAASVKVVHTVM